MLMLPVESKPSDARLLTEEGITAIKSEPSVRVDLVTNGSGATVHKKYLNSGLRLLQTMGRQSRAAREFANLKATAAAGLPCTKPIGWHEDRRLGMVHNSTLITQFVADTQPLKSFLRELPDEAYHIRRNITEQIGRRLSQLHAHGILWCSPMPRNFLVQNGSEGCKLVLCDLPAAVRYASEVPQHATLIDLFDAIASPSRRRDFSKTDRLRCLRAYTSNDPAATRRLWQLLNRISVRGHRSRKAFLRTLRTYIFPARATRPQ